MIGNLTHHINIKLQTIEKLDIDTWRDDETYPISTQRMIEGAVVQTCRNINMHEAS